VAGGELAVGSGGAAVGQEPGGSTRLREVSAVGAKVQDGGGWEAGRRRG